MTSPTKAYLISYDNGQSYEDHHREPLFLVPSHEEAQRIVSVSKAWIDTARDQRPEDPFAVYQRDGSQEEYQQAYDAVKAYTARLVVPFGIEELRETVGPYPDRDGYLVVTEIPYWSPSFNSFQPTFPTTSAS